MVKTFVAAAYYYFYCYVGKVKVKAICAAKNAQVTTA